MWTAFILICWVGTNNCHHDSACCFDSRPQCEAYIRQRDRELMPLKVVTGFCR